MAALAVFWTGYMVVFFINLALALLAVWGLVWMPFGAFIYAMEGKKKGQSPIRYAVSGAICSLLFYIPWLYVKKWIENKPVPHKNIIWAYAFLYLVWLFGPTPVWLVLFLSSSDTSGAFILLPLAFVALTSIILMRARKQSGVSNGYFPRFPYLLPLFGLYVNFVPIGIIVLRSMLE